MKRSDSILLNYYRGNLPKYQQRPGTVNNDAILAYMRGLPGGAPRPQLSQQQIAQLVSKTKPLTQLSATQIKQQQYNLKQKEQDAAEERSRQFREEEERRLQAERAAARRTREAVIGGDENAMFTFPTGETKRWRDMNWREQQYVAGKNLGALNRGDWTDYINPLAMIGSLSEGLATAPYSAKQSDSYLPYVFGVGAPLLTGALAGVGAKTTGQFVENIVSPIPGNLSNISNALRNRYINIATGNNPLNYAWRSPAKGITDEQADLMLEQLRNDIPLDAISKDLLADYQHTSGPFTGRFESGNINLFKRAGLEDAIAQRNVVSSTGKPTVIVRRFDPENSELYGLNEAGVFESNRPTSWSVGKGAEYTTKKDRLVVQLPSNTRALLNEYNFSKFGQDVGKLKEERELIMGSGSRFKPLNRVKNELGGYDYIHRFEGYNPTVWDDIRGLNAENLAQRVDLSKDIGQGGHFNAGVYPFKRDPNILIKLGRTSQNESFGINAPNIKTGIPEDLSEFPTEAWGRMAIPFREIDLSTITPQTLKRAIRPDSQILGTMMQRVKGKPLSEYSVEDLANIEPYVYQGLASDVKQLAKKNVGVDFYGDNFHLNVYPSGYKSFNLFDLGRLPNTNTGVFPVSALHGLNAKAFSQGVNEIDPKMIKSILGDKIKNAIYESSRNAGEGAYSDQEVYEAIQKALQNISEAKFKKGGPIVNPRGYIDGQPPKGSNWRIPGDGMGTSITMDLPNMPDEILVVPDGDFDQAKVMKRGEEEYFAGADFVDEYTMGPGGTTGPKIAVRDYPTMKGGGLTANKAREILHHGEVHGRPLTEKQRRYFGAMSKGHTKNYQLGGNALAMLRDYGGGISVPRLNSPSPKAQQGLEVMKGEDFVKGWMNSPMYQQMLSASATGEEYDRISKGRIGNLNQPRLITSSGTLPEETLGQTSIRVRNLLNATFEEREELMNALQNAVNNPKDKDAKRLVNKLMGPAITGWDIKINNKLKPGTVDYESTLAHEIGHTTDRPLITKLPNQMTSKEAREQDIRNFIPVSDMEKMSGYNKDKLTSDFNKYVATPEETRQYLNDVRYFGKQQGVYDPFTQKITPELYKKIKPLEGKDPRDILSSIYTEDQIIDMLNSISKVNRQGIPKAQLGLPIKSTTPVISPILNLIDLFAGDKEDVAAKPKAPEVTLEEYFNIVDPRKIRATTGKPINPNVDLVAGQYPSSYIAQELKLAKQKGLSKEDAWNLAAIAFQESGWGKTDRNLGHVIGPAGKGNYGSSLINAYMNKMAEADRLGITDPYTRLQVYNGLGKIFPSTEQKYHGFKMKKIYGVPVPQGGLSLRDNPLYGKQVVDIRENVLKKNPEVVQYVESLYKKDGGVLPKAQVGEEITYTHQPSRIRDGFVDLGPGESYMLKRTVTPYTKNRDIRRYTQAPTDPRQVNFISNYAGAIGEPLSKSYGEYPTAVPFEGEKHWNIDRFIIEPGFRFSSNTMPKVTDFGQAKKNVLADMYKYNMLQGQDRNEAFRNAKKFVRKEVTPRVNSRYQKEIDRLTNIHNESITTFTRGNPFIDLRNVNNDQSLRSNPYYKQYFENPLTEREMKQISKSYLKNFKKMSGKESRKMIKDWIVAADEYDRQYERDKANPQPTKSVEGCPPGYEYNVEVQDCLPIQKQLQMGGGFGVFGYVGDGWYKNGGQHGGLDRWFAEKWVDIKSGKPCGRQEGESRAYPACRPSKRVSSKTPKTSGEMSSSEKAKFKSSKTSSQRIPYNHKRR